MSNEEGRMIDGPWDCDACQRRQVRRCSALAGFTLVEILIAIGIIAILAGLAIPIIASARERSRQSVCISNLRQIGQALQMYKTDYHDDAWPFRLELKAYLAQTDLVCPNSPHDEEGKYANWNIMFDYPLVADFLRERAEARGPMYPVVFCMNHTGWGAIPVLRADGSVHRRTVPEDCSLGVIGPSKGKYINTTDL
jgi:prepilin-type N-terminal cleavage/methylation domain-containing protein